ncbi:MAG: chloride channel protein [Pseudooceanicola sp.]|nr:chloride channel protein [Pseudooceanicola sp.]
MTEPDRSFLIQQRDLALAAMRDGWVVMRQRGPSQVQFWFIALLVGLASGFAALFFRKGIEALQAALYRTGDVQFLHSHASSLPWFWIVLLPVFGGLAVGLILHVFTRDGRARGVADVIEGAALRDGRVETKAGLASALASLVTLSSGGSSGREGPVVHLAGVVATLVCRKINADGITGRDLLGCAVAAAVSASFNAPIAGALFALEVVLRHFAVHAFAPIVIASVAGTVINRLAFGDVTEFVLSTPGALKFYVELPAFLILGLLCGLVSAALMRGVFWAEDVGSWLQRLIRLPGWLRPAVAGLMLGLLAVGFPHIIGVGYETTYRALAGELVLHEAVVFAVLKAVAVAITFGGRMGGGIFSPALMVGALTGLAFGLIATGVLPSVSGAHTLYAFAGMGAVAAAVLGAPISTTLIVFELTGDWQIGIAVMTSVSLSTALASRLVDRSFFLTQLERRDIHLAAGPQAYLLAMFRAGAVMRPLGDARAPDKERLEALLGEGLAIAASATLEQAMPLLERAEGGCLAVTATDRDGVVEVVGALFHVDALKAYNRALAATAAEEHS